MDKRSFRIMTIGFVLLNLLIHFSTSTNYELHRDEMLYFAMGSHLSFYVVIQIFQRFFYIYFVFNVSLRM